MPTIEQKQKVPHKLSHISTIYLLFQDHKLGVY